MCYSSILSCRCILSYRTFYYFYLVVYLMGQSQRLIHSILLRGLDLAYSSRRIIITNYGSLIATLSSLSGVCSLNLALLL